MTIYTIKMTEKEADEVAKGDKMFVFRDSALGIKAGDELHFQVMFKAKPRPHKVESMKFEVTYASEDAPVGLAMEDDSQVTVQTYEIEEDDNEDNDD